MSEHGSKAVHLTVLMEEAIDAMVGDVQGHYVDATYGLGGHTRLLLSRLGKNARVSVFDKDPQAVEAAQQLAQTDSRVQVVHSSFVALSDFPNHSISGILMDLGVSSPQLDQAERGFSFQQDGPLDMRMDNTRGLSVAQWLKDASLAQIKEVIHEYGEERYAFPIAKAIVARRQAQGPITRTAELAQIVAAAVKTREQGKNPATRTFQAFRIFINAELAELRIALDASLQALAVGGRLVVIAFHSLEDRIVKRFIADNSKEVVDRRALFAPPQALPLRALGRFRPSAQEVQNNPRARSAIMRVAERTDALIEGVGQLEARAWS